MTTFRNVANHPQDLHDGRILPPGGEVNLSKEEADSNKDLIDDETLVNVDEMTKASKAASKEGGSNE